MSQISSTECCAIDELYGIMDDNDPVKSVMTVCEERYEEEGDQAFVMFTDIKERKIGKALAQYILKHKLGTIVNTRARKNPNSGNKVSVWIWGVNDRNLRAWYRKQEGIKRIVRDFY